MTKNAYVHIPFCKSKCNYCSFVSSDDLNAKKAYLDALESQINSEYKHEKLNTLYFGGGTPSLLTIEEFKKLIDLFSFKEDAEITVEVNPDSVDLVYLVALRALGVNRLSIGIQTFDNEILRIIGRRHSAKQALDAVVAAQNAGFNNISIDFIYGLPNQAIECFEADLKKACELNIQHVSLYGLKIEENSVFGRNLPKNIADSDVQADMYLKAIEVLTQNGFEHYEISNFSRSGFNSRHNLNYWDANTYYGFGCAASGYFDNLRYTKEIDLLKYIKNPMIKYSQEELSEQDALEEAIFLGFRKIAGIDTSKINSRFNIDFDNKYSKILEKYTDYFVRTELGWALNTNGILISNDILSEFID